MTIRQIAAVLNVSRAGVGNYTKAYVRNVPKKLRPAMPKRPRGRPPTGRQFYDDPRFDHPPEDEYADVIPIPFFPADLPRLIPDPFGWTPTELRSALVYAQKKEPIMYVEASNLRLINIGHLIEVVAEGVTVMGKLERVKRNPATAKVTLRISGDSVCVAEDQRVNIRRSPELHELHLASMGVEDLVDAEILGSRLHTGVGV
jgi:hypothetical protein